MACIECLTKLEARPYFERDFGVRDSLAFTALFRLPVTWTETIRDRQPHSVFTGRLDPNRPQFRRHHPVYDSPNRRNGMSDQEPNRSEKRLQDIERRIAKMQGDRDDAAKPSRAALPVGMGAILSRVATELVAGVMVGAFMGWVLDRWLGTSPLFLVLMFFLGASAGMLNVWRMMSGRGMATGYFDEHRQDAGADKQERDGE